MSVGHVAGPVAAQALEALVGQFADRTSFVRELVQNSLDAGAGRVDVDFHLDPGGLSVEVTDDGEGMDLAIIESCLLTLFRSSKERDLTKIGKFGVGFVSLFALEPRRVVVDTARDGLHHRVVFAEDRSYTLLEVPTPFEGTRVRIETSLRGEHARSLAQATREALAYWCRFARAEIWTECAVDAWGWEPTVVTGEFTVDAPVTVTVEEPGFRAVLGPSGRDTSPVAFHNRGLTLLESEEDLVPGVTFRVEAAALEHTLTRDNVLRDAQFREVVARLAAIAREQLQPRWLQALQVACTTGDSDARRALLAVTHPTAFPIPPELPCYADVEGTLRSVDELRPRGLVAWTRRALGDRPTVFTAEAPSPLTAAAAEAGLPVLASPDTPPDPLVAALAERAGVQLVPLHTVHRVAVAVEAPPLVEAASALVVAHCAEPEGLSAAELHPPGDVLALRLDAPGTLLPAAGTGGDGPLHVNLGHPLLARLSDLPVAIAAPLLARAVTGGLHGGPLPDGLLEAARSAATGDSA